jgi:Tetratricopeptide repeat
VVEATAHAQRLRAVSGRAVRPLNAVGSSIRDMGQLDTSRPVLNCALAMAQTQLGPDHRGALTARANLAHWQNRQPNDG